MSFKKVNIIGDPKDEEESKNRKISKGVKLYLLTIIVVFSLAATLLFLVLKDEESKNSQEAQFPISAGVVPHYLVAGEIIEQFFSYIASEESPKTIVLLGPDHFNAGSVLGSSFITIEPDIKEFQEVLVDTSSISSLSLENDFAFSKSSVGSDHGITDLIPFLRKYFPDSKIIPVLIPSNISLEQTEQFAISLNSLASPETLVIASVDFSHYLPALAAGFHDIKSIRTLINFEKEEFEELEVDSWQALYIARAFAHLKNKEFPKVIAHSNSIDFLKDEVEETTSYFSVVFEKGKPNGLPSEALAKEVKTILFVGDIMLDRGTEYYMQKNSIFYPFQKTTQFTKGVDIVLGNLEGPIVKNPKEFSDESLMFAFDSETISGLNFGNFNLLSLANNHTLNMGENGLAETRELLKGENIGVAGDPIECKKEFSYQKDNIMLLAFNKTFPFSCKDEEITGIIKSVKTENPESFLVVSMHWGEEYQMEGSFFQQKLAHKIIEAGADLIIGHHPHVVQEVEIYKEKLIFYSLGNFIFDQYFSKETQQGLAIGLEVWPERPVFRIFPIQIKQCQPFLMEREQSQEFLENLAEKSSPQLVDGIKKGIIEIEPR